MAIGGGSATPKGQSEKGKIRFSPMGWPNHPHGSHPQTSQMAAPCDPSTTPTILLLLLLFFKKALK
jgi:hypothetical protein